jgi:hypothetical protein
MFAASMVQYVDTKFGFYYPGGDWASFGMVDAPYGDWGVSLNGGGWGNNYNWYGLLEGNPTEEAGSRSGGVSMRVARQGVITFATGTSSGCPRPGGAGHQLEPRPLQLGGPDQGKGEVPLGRGVGVGLAGVLALGLASVGCGPAEERLPPRRRPPATAAQAAKGIEDNPNISPEMKKRINLAGGQAGTR